MGGDSLLAELVLLNLPAWILGKVVLKDVLPGPFEVGEVGTLQTEFVLLVCRDRLRRDDVGHDALTELVVC